MTSIRKVLLLAALPLFAEAAELPTTGLILHLDAASITGVSSGGALPLNSSWSDKSPSGVVTNTIKPPVYIADAGGGYPSVRFDGTGQYLEANVATSGDTSIFVVFFNRRSGALNVPAYPEPLLAASGANPALWLATSRLNSVSTATGLVTPDYLSFQGLPASGVTVRTWVNGRDTSSAGGEILNGRFYVGSAIYQNLPAASSLFIGSSDATGSQSSKNDIRELLIYNRALTTGERQTVQRYLAKKYDIELVWRPLDDAVEAWPHVLGSQEFGPQYSFGETGIRVLDYARATLQQGNRVVKFRLNPKKYATEDGFTAMTGINTLTKLVRDQPEVKAVLDLPLTDFLFWTVTNNYSEWQNDANIDSLGLKPAVQQAIYDEMKELATYLLTTYNGTGKRFYLGNWEGDWMLATGYTDPTQIPQNRIQAMIDWANIRQKAIDDAKAATPHSNVQVWYYLEMNKVDWMRDGLPCVANSVIPALTKLDMISVSSYTLIKNNGDLASQTRFNSDLNTIQALLAAKPNPAITGSRLIIGEYGWTYDPAKSYGTSLTAFAQQHLNTVRRFLQWQGGTLRFILQWQFFNLQAGDGDATKLAQIDQNKLYTPLYYLHENFYRSMRRWLDDYRTRTGVMPTGRAYADQADYVLSSLSLAKYTPTVTFTNYSDWKSYHFIDAAEYADQAVSGATADPYARGVSNLLCYALSLGKFSENSERMPAVLRVGDELRFTIPYETAKTDLRWMVDATTSLNQWNTTVFDSSLNSATIVDGWLQVSAAGIVNPANSLFYRLRLQLSP